MADWLNYINEFVFCVTDFNSLDIHEDDVDIYTHLHIQRKGIMRITSVVNGLSSAWSPFKRCTFSRPPSVRCSTTGSMQNVITDRNSPIHCMLIVWEVSQALCLFFFFFYINYCFVPGFNTKKLYNFHSKYY